MEVKFKLVDNTHIYANKIGANVVQEGQSPSQVKLSSVFCVMLALES